jgi:peptide deformylase
VSEEATEVEAPAAPAEREGLSEEQRARRAAALAEVRSFGDPALRSRASEVRDFDEDLATEAGRMIAIMGDAIGVGLAATQLGIMRRLLVFQAGAEATPTALVNPEVEWVSDDGVVAEEGCLSLPGIAVDVERPLHARVRGVDLRGEPMLLEASGLEARVLQHEVDHLDGVLILDRTSREQRKGALGALREGTGYAPPHPDEDGAGDEDG